ALAANAAAYPNAVAMREKERGIWKEVTWSELLDWVLRCAAGLEAHGFREGDAMLVLGDNRVRLYAGMLAIGMLRGHATPTYTGITLDELFSVVENVRVVAALAEDQEHVDKVLDLRGRGVDIATIVYDDPRGLNAYQAHGLVSWDQLLATGAERLKEDPSLRADLLARAGPDDTAVFLYSSG